MSNNRRFAMTLFAPLGALCVALAAAHPAAAQESTTRGFNLGGHLLAAGVSIEKGEQHGGGGAGLHVGYGVNRIIGLFAALDGSKIDVANENVNGSWEMAHIDLGVRFHFANTLRSWVPYLETAFTSRQVTVTNPRVNNQNVNKLDFNGGAFTVGGGMSFYFNESLALDLDLKLSAGQFTSIGAGNATVSGLDIDAGSTRFALGLLWWK